VFQDGSFKAIMPAQAPPKHAVPLHISHCIWTGAITLPKEPHSPTLFPATNMNTGPSTRKCTKPRQGWVQVDATDFNRFPFNNFTYCLTLFPKCFSSFPHGTCSLSVSRQYLALEGIYLPFWAAIPNNSTRWERITKHWEPASRTGFSPSMMFRIQETCTQSSTENTSLDYNSGSQRLPDFKFELIPLHSPLLGESLLVSFPPLIDMLKFSG
jgi:hypothetical protein